MVQTRSHTTRLPEHGMLVHYRSFEPKRKVKLSKAGEIKRRRVTVVDTHDDPTYDADSNMPIDDAEPSQLHVTPLKPSANEKRQCCTRGLCGPENAADSKRPGQNGEHEIEADPAAYLMRTDMAGEKQDEVAAGEHKRAPEEVFPAKVSRSLITKKGQSSDAQKTPTEEAVDEASPLDYKQSDEARPKTSENKRVCMMRTVVKMVQGKRFSGDSVKGVRSRKVNKNLKGSPQTPFSQIST